MSVNKVILVGNCCKDPETKYMTNGEAVTNLSIATNEKWKDKAGNKQEKAEFHNLVFYRRLAEVAGEYLKKGAQIYVEGKLATRKWQDKEGKDRYTTEIIVNELQMLGGKQDGGQSVNTPANKPESTSNQGSGIGLGDLESDLPF